MALQDWHGGKIIIMWVVAVPFAFVGSATVAAFAYALGLGSDAETNLIGLLFAAAVFVACVAVSWSWLSAKEKKPESL